MKVTKKGNELVITIPLQKPALSKSAQKARAEGKSGGGMVVATSNGFMPTDVTVDGKNVRLSVNAIISAD